jgi:hypothetical protein
MYNIIENEYASETKSVEMLLCTFGDKGQVF